MNRDEMLMAVEKEIGRLQQIAALLRADDELAPVARRSSKAKARRADGTTTIGKRVRKPMSAEAKARIAEAQKARWAKFRKAKKA